MVRILRTEDDGWYYATVVLQHNHRMAESIGERKIWKCHNHIDSSVKDLVSHLRLNNVSLTKVYGVIGQICMAVMKMSLSERGLSAACVQQ